MIWPMVEQAHFGTTRYTMLSLSVIQVPGKPMPDVPGLPAPVLFSASYPLQKTKESRFIQRPFTSIKVNNQAKLGQIVR
ncbi:hypothetical protein [Pseudoponticoccus marisrubri]|uniref:hypothetical protein n=1 Tax=Pseudoponticoccus marisrubri TaxID=1685382 RepID=UPI001470062C|nr:hypothetical protein [Pseudoponticoccus marisrubri]